MPNWKPFHLRWDRGLRELGRPDLRTRLDRRSSITAGCGWVQREGGPIEEVRPCDVAWFPPGGKHWHGATPTTVTTHIAIREQLDGRVVDWLAHVSDEQYRK
jgi:hypothetical protein